MRKSLIVFSLFLAILASFSSVCFADDNNSKTDQLTLGTIQTSVRIGMSQADVITALGSPNIATKDSEGKETWIYDKLSTQVKQSSGGGYFTLLLFGIGRNHDNYTSSQKTLTVIIKFNNNLVESVNYHSSSF